MWGFILVAMAMLAAGCGSDPSCSNACDALKACSVSASGLSCDSNCKEDACAGCINGASCSDLASGSCSADCPGVTFTKA